MDNHECQTDKAYSLECGSIMLGALIKETKRLKLPLLGSSFAGWSVEKICKAFGEMDSPKWYNHSKAHKCSFTELRSAVDLHLNETTGLALEDFEDRGEEVTNMVTVGPEDVGLVD